MRSCLTRTVLPGLVLLGLLGYEEWHRRKPPDAGLRAAARRDDVAAVGRALQAGADPNFCLFENEPLLIEALKAGRMELARVLLEHGADPNRPGPKPGAPSPLLVALDAGSEPLLRMLVAHGADPNGPDRTGAPLLFRALRHKAAEQVRLLLAAGADPNRADSGGAAWAERGGFKTRSGDEAKAARFGPMEPAELRGSTPLMHAVRGEQLEALRLLLEHGAQPNLRDEQGAGALIHAVRYPQASLRVIELLLGAGADPGLRDERGWTALDWARQVRWSDARVVALLRSAGARPAAAS
jgi:uncharacterized protein